MPVRGTGHCAGPFPFWAPLSFYVGRAEPQFIRAKARPPAGECPPDILPGECREFPTECYSKAVGGSEAPAALPWSPQTMSYARCRLHRGGCRNRSGKETPRSDQGSIRPRAPGFSTFRDDVTAPQSHVGLFWLGCSARLTIHCMVKYSVELFREGGEGAGVERVLARHKNLTVARTLYKDALRDNPGRLVMLCDRARVLARSDRPETMPQ